MPILSAMRPNSRTKRMKPSQRDSVGRSLLEIRARLATLTPREGEVLDYVVARKSKEKIAGKRSKVEQTFKINLARDGKDGSAVSR